MTWNEGEDESTGTVGVSVDGSVKEVDRSQSFGEKIQELARDEGYSHYKVFVDGTEIEPEDAPEDFTGLDDISIVKYDKAA